MVAVIGDRRPVATRAERDHQRQEMLLARVGEMGVRQPVPSSDAFGPGGRVGVGGRSDQRLARMNACSRSYVESSVPGAQKAIVIT